MKCEICNTEYIDARRLSNHLKKEHNLTAKEYHDTILKTNNKCNNPACDNTTTFKNLGVGYLRYCSNKCNTDHNANDNIKKMTKHFQDIYGVDNCSSLKVVCEKRKITCNEKYGGNAPLCSDKIKDKVKNTNLVKYGSINTFQVEEFKTKSKLTCLNKYGVENIMHSNEFALNKNRLDSLKRIDLTLNKAIPHLLNLNIEIVSWEKTGTYNTFRCNLCNHEFIKYTKHTFHEIKCPKCNQGTSIENKIKLLLDEYEINYEINNRSIIDPYELDFYLPEHKVAIECHGIYWHSEQILLTRNINASKYHLIKYNLCKDNDIQLLQFYESEINDKFDIVKNIILAKCNKLTKLCGARECIIKTTDNNIFLNDNHIQGNNNGQRINVGAYYNNELVSLMSFKTERNRIELDRFCTIKNYYIPGIASKLFSYFINNNDCEHIISFADKRISNGNLYKAINFNYVSDVNPSYYYNIGGTLKHKFGFRKEKLKTKLEQYDSNLTEYQNMLKHGYDRIWDAGKIKYEWKK